jgi:hypothetical protein
MPVAKAASVPAVSLVAKAASVPTAVALARPASAPPAVAVAKPAAAPASAAVVAAKPASAPTALAAAKPAPASPTSNSIPAVTALASAPSGGNCAALDAMAGKAGVPVAAARAQRRVSGSGRLQFYTAPASTCVMPGIFILTQEAVKAYADHAGYTLVKYVNPRNGFEVTGWVQSGRVAPD